MSDWWQGRCWRLIQTNLREIDMADIRADRVVADLKEFHANVLMINAAGIIASYPTKLPFHFQSPCLTGDSLADVLAACHAADIRAIARTDFSKVRRPIHEAHPHWAYRSPAGEIVDYNGDVHVCLNSPYQQEHMLEILAELLDGHDFDGVFFNMAGYQTRDYSGNYYGPCHCDNCRRRFEEMFHLPLPVREDMEDAAYRKYAVFKRLTQRAHHEKVYRFLHNRWPGLCVANHCQFARGFVRQESNTAVDRPLPHWQYSASDNTRWAAGTCPSMVSSNTTVDFIDIPYRHVAVSPHQQRLRMAQNLANGGALDYYLIGRLDNHEDRSGFAAVKELFAWHAANERAYAGMRSCADVALLSGPHGNVAEYRGWFRMLVENHFLFDSLRTDLTEVPWERYRAVILPDLQAIGDDLAERIDRFAAAGGTVVAAGRCGFRDEDYEPRDRPALRCLGIEHVEAVREHLRPAYIKLDDKRGLRRFDETDLVYLDGLYVEAACAVAAERRWRLIPPHPFGPPERCCYSEVSDWPGAVVHPFGRGRCIWLPWLPGSLFHRQGHTNTTDFLADVLESLAGLEPVGGDLSPMVEVTWMRAADGRGLLHLVNASGHFGTSFFGPAVMTDVAVVLPLESRPRSVRGLVGGGPCEHGWTDARLTVRLRRLGLFEAIEID